MATLETKEMINLDELSSYTGLSKSYIYKLTHRKELPHYKPSGKKLYFKASEVLEWLMQNRVSTNQELEAEASNYLLNAKTGNK